MLLPGKATAEGTHSYQVQSEAQREHFRRLHGLTFSTIGMGTYLGDPDSKDDAKYEEAIRIALGMGCNVFDCAINYRCMRSEKAVGRALARALQSGFQRNQVVVSTKGGFIPFQDEPAADVSEYFRERYVEPGICSSEDLAGGCHCMTPRYLKHELETSRSNLGLETIDIYYLHNPETQRSQVTGGEFSRRIRAAFEFLEQACAENQIGLYGTATWNGFRVAPVHPEHLSLRELLKIAAETGGEEHHFRVLQLPFNLAMTEALTQATQDSGSGKVSLLRAADENNMIVMTSASLCQGRLARGLPNFVSECLPGLQSDVQRALQFARSAPGVTTALVGMKEVEHARHNLVLSGVPPASVEQFNSLFGSAG
ncbi:MAG: aldo/keto reductase [Acidobacteria bacterium]|nr:aldo/keto reductase [Acidobacteriota bacterium]